MIPLIIVNNPKKWNLKISNADVISARSYLTDPKYSDLRHVTVFNLCKSYRYQSLGYYVSLLASARGHKPIPNLQTIQDMKSMLIVRLISEDLDDLIQESLKPIHSQQFTLSIYFGKNVAKRHTRLSKELFNLFHTPFIRADFRKIEEHWRVQSINPISANEIPADHIPFVKEVAEEFFASNRFTIKKRNIPRYDMAILYAPDEKLPPSNDEALKKFISGAKKLGIGAELIEKDEYSNLAEFDALFIRETTHVNHHTYRFACRAAAEGLVVIDDPESIVKCTNKVFLAELLERNHIPYPKTLIVHRDNKDQILHYLTLPCIIKQPDSSFSQGVVKAETEESLHQIVNQFLSKSELIIVQEFIPTEFDWRVGIFDRQPLYVCKYHMAPQHWQIMNIEKEGNKRYGRVETFAVEHAPRQVVQIALKAANLIGDGLYGVDLKQIGKSIYIIEINDNPNIDAGYEDRVLKSELYIRMMSIFLKRIEHRKNHR